MWVCSRSACCKGQRWRRPLLNTENRLMREEGRVRKWEETRRETSGRETIKQQCLKRKEHNHSKSEDTFSRCTYWAVIIVPLYGKIHTFVEFPCKIIKCKYKLFNNKMFFNQDGSNGWWDCHFYTLTLINTTWAFHCFWSFKITEKMWTSTESSTSLSVVTSIKTTVRFSPKDLCCSFLMILCVNIDMT